MAADRLQPPTDCKCDPDGNRSEFMRPVIRQDDEGGAG
jgi:hypothetical protein